MKKFNLLTVAAASLALGVVTLAGCSMNTEISGEGTVDIVADPNKEDCIALFNQAFDELFKDPNVVIESKENGKIDFTQNLYKETSKVVTSDNKTFYAFKDKEQAIVATEYSSDYKYIELDEERYEFQMRYFLGGFNFEVVEDENATWSCEYHETNSDKISGDKVESHSEGKYSFELKATDYTMTAEIEMKDGLPEEIDYKGEFAHVDDNFDVDMTFTYGNAKFTLPDITGWPNQTK